MAINFISGGSKGGQATPQVTTSFDSSGADCIVVGVMSNDVTISISDSKSNTIGAAIIEQLYFSFALTVYLYIPTSVGASHTVTVGASGGRIAISALAYSGVHQTLPLDDFVQGAISEVPEVGVETFSLAPLTPAAIGEEFISFLGHISDGPTTTTHAITESFTTRHLIPHSASDGSQRYGLFSADKMNAGSGALDPVWTWVEEAFPLGALLALSPAESEEETMGIDIRTLALGFPPTILRLGVGEFIEPEPSTGGIYKPILRVRRR